MKMTKKITISRVIRLIIGTILIIVFAFVPVFTEPGFPLCFSQLFFNLTCPMCGMTRAFIAIEHFEFETAFLMNPLVFVAYFLFMFCFLQDLYVMIFEHKRYSFVEYMMGYSNHVDN